MENENPEESYQFCWSEIISSITTEHKCGAKAQTEKQKNSNRVERIGKKGNWDRSRIGLPALQRRELAPVCWPLEIPALI